jgi:hypothetical protein
MRVSLYVHLNQDFYFSQPEVPHQTDAHRSKLLSTYGAEELYRAKRKCNATQEHDINLLEGELVAVLEQKDPLGSTSRWFVDTGCKFLFPQTNHSYFPGVSACLGMVPSHNPGALFLSTRCKRLRVLLLPKAPQPRKRAEGGCRQQIL